MPAPDPYGFFGHFDREMYIILILCAILVVFSAVYDNAFLIIVAVVCLSAVIIFQAIRNYRRRIRYKYAPTITTPNDEAGGY